MSTRFLVSMVIGLLVAALGCYLATALIPGGPPRLIAQVLSVILGLGPAATSGLRDR